MGSAFNLIMSAIRGAGVTRGFGVGERFEVPAKSGFEIEVRAGICEYICSFLSA